jgi:UDP-N-acetylglucosamine/UDP-N-acetylgalactosamine 4-epimerase
MTFSSVESALRSTPRRWLVTGVAGFIGSNLLETLLGLGQEVVGVDDFSTGHQRNLEDVASRVGRDLFAAKFRFYEGSLISQAVCEKACEGVEIVLHQGALGSVPRSIEDPVRSNDANVSAFVQLAAVAKNAGVRRFVYASSSSVYGDCEDEYKVEHSLGSLLSPYAVTKRVNELYASVFSSLYPLEMVGLRYFNVFGPRQDPNGAYAAVIPRWLGQLLSGQQCVVYGDGLTSRDFCFVKNVVQANILAGTVPSSGSTTSFRRIWDDWFRGSPVYRSNMKSSDGAISVALWRISQKPSACWATIPHTHSRTAFEKRWSGMLDGIRSKSA